MTKTVLEQINEIAKDIIDKTAWTETWDENYAGSNVRDKIKKIIELSTIAGYYDRAAVLLETIRELIGHGYGEGDIEHITSIVKARLEAWDLLTWQGRGISYTLTEPLMEAIDIAAERPTTIGALMQLHFMLNIHKEVKK